MNRQQKEYALAKAKAQTLSEMQGEREAEFLKNCRYVNEDGEVPTRLWMIDDEEEFIRLSHEFGNHPSNLMRELNKAEDAQKKAEDALIDYALSIIPVKPRDTLRRNLNNYSIRKRILDAAFRLDTRTVPKKEVARNVQKNIYGRSI